MIFFPELLTDLGQEPNIRQVEELFVCLFFLL